MEKLNVIQKRNRLNDVWRVDDKGPGGAYHHYVITKNGVIQVKDLKIGDKVLTTNNTFNTVKNITEKELKKAFKIRTKSGKEIIVSEDHRIPTDKGLMSLRLGLKVGSKVFVHE